MKKLSVFSLGLFAWLGLGQIGSLSAEEPSSTDQPRALLGAGTEDAITHTLQSASTSVTPPNGLVSWWSGDGNANDLVGDNHGILKNSATFAAGLVGEAFFLTNGAYIEIPNAPSLNYTGKKSLTIELWAYRTGLESSMHIVSKRITDKDMEYQIAMDPYYGLQLTAGPFGYVPNSATEIKTYAMLPLNAWTHLAVTFDGNMWKFYINGMLASWGQGILGPENNEPLRIGIANSPNPYPFVGLLDEISLYNRALSSAEIQAIYAAGSAGKSNSNIKPVPATIVQQPQGQATYPGANVFFSVKAEGAAPIHYQWQFNHQDLPRETNAFLLVDNVTTDHAGIYTVTVSNSVRAVISEPAVLRVWIPLTIAQQPENVLGIWGKQAEFGVVAIGNEPLCYQWRKDGLPIAGATNNSLTLTNLTLTGAGKYSVVISNEFLATISDEAVLRVNPAGVSIGLYAGVLIDGVPGKTYNILAVTNFMATNYWLVNTNITLTNATQLWIDSTVDPRSDQKARRYYLVNPVP